MNTFYVNQKSKKEDSKFEYLYIELENPEKYIKKEIQKEDEDCHRGIIIIDIL